jgi:hypothetical protein
VVRALVAIALAAAVAIGACTLLDDDPPTNTCKVDNDCFRTQETCSPQSHTCVPKADAGIDAP